MPLIKIIIIAFLASVALTSEHQPIENTGHKLTVYSFPSQIPEVTSWAKSHDILKEPIIIFAKTNPKNEEFEAYFAADGLLSLPTESKGRVIYESLKSEDSAVMLLPTCMTLAELKSYENYEDTELVSQLKSPGLATLGLILASTLGIPWLFSGSESKNNTSEVTTPPKTYKHNLQSIYYLQLSDYEVKLLENIYSLSRVFTEEP